MIPYIRIETIECLEARKNFLSSEINLLNLVKRINSYKKIRKLELMKKSCLRRSIKQASTKISSLVADLPPVETDRLTKHMSHKESINEINKRKGIEVELAEIKAKLSQLS